MALHILLTNYSMLLVLFKILHDFYWLI